MSLASRGTISGDLADVSLVDVLQVIGVTERSGVLTVQQAEQRVSLTFNRGRIVIAQLDPPRHHLASYFLRQGWIDFETLHEALRRQGEAETYQLVGQILIEMGALDRKQLVAGLQHHVREVIAEMLAWNRGTFTFDDEGPNAPHDHERLGVGLTGDELRGLAEEARSLHKSAPDSTRDPTTGFARALGDASWLAKPRLALVVTDDLLIHHGLELRLRSEAFALVASPGLQEVGGLLLASGDPGPSLLIDLDLIGRSRTTALQAFHWLRRWRREWPNLRLFTFGRRVPEGFYQFILRSPVSFHVPRATPQAEADIHVLRDFIEVLTRQLVRGSTPPPRGLASLFPSSPPQSRVEITSGADEEDDA